MLPPIGHRAEYSGSTTSHPLFSHPRPVVALFVFSREQLAFLVAGGRHWCTLFIGHPLPGESYTSVNCLATSFALLEEIQELLTGWKNLLGFDAFWLRGWLLLSNSSVGTAWSGDEQPVVRTRRSSSSKAASLASAIYLPVQGQTSSLAGGGGGGFRFTGAAQCGWVPGKRSVSAPED